MAVREKLAPRILSLSATLAGVAICGWLWTVGESNPRRYVSSMAINNHNGYGRTYACRECHIPSGGFYTTPTCITSGCHGELMPSISKEERLASILEQWDKRSKLVGDEKRERKAQFYLDRHLHESYASCATCHTEHKPKQQIMDESYGGEFVSIPYSHTQEMASLLHGKSTDTADMN